MIRSAAMALGALVLLAGALRFASSIADLHVEVVRVAGALNDGESAQVRDAVSKALAAPGLRTASGVAEAVQALDWVREVRVRRQWPDGLHVAVARETLAARWGDAGWLTTSGNVVAAPADANDPRLAKLPSLRASASDGARAMRVFAVLGHASRSAGLRLVALEEDAAGEWRASFAGEANDTGAGTVDVLLGATDLRERLMRFGAVYRRALRDARRPLLYADARYDTGVAVRWGAVEAPSAGAKLQLAAMPPQRTVRLRSDAAPAAARGVLGFE